MVLAQQRTTNWKSLMPAPETSDEGNFVCPCGSVLKDCNRNRVEKHYSTLKHREWIANWLLSGVRVRNPLKFGENSATLGDLLNFAGAIAVAAEGDVAYSGDVFSYKDSTGTRTVVNTDTVQTMTSKVMDANNNTFSNFTHGNEVDNSSAGVHGVIGSVVGTTDVQTLTNKTISGATYTGSQDGSAATWSDLGIVTTVDINGGSIDGAAIGAVVAAAGNFSSIGATTPGTIAGTTGSFTGVVSASTVPTQPAHLTNKQYVDAVAQGLSVRDSVRAATVNAEILTDIVAGYILDGVTLVAGDRVLVKDQTGGNQVQNGIYDVNTGPTAPTRATDYASGAAVASTFMFVEEGTTSADTGWTCTNNSGTDVVGTDNLSFTQFSGAGSITAGAGLTKTGNTIDVVGGNTMSVGGDIIDVSMDPVGSLQSSANGLAIKTLPAGGIFSDATGLQIKTDVNGAMETSALGIGINLDSTLTSGPVLGVVNTNDGSVATGTPSRTLKTNASGQLKVTQIQTGDIMFANEWKMTESWEDGSTGPEPQTPESVSDGMWLVNKEGEKVFKIDNLGNLHIKGEVKQINN